MKKVQVQLYNPCNQHWNDLTDVDNGGRHCELCSKEVHDFSGMSREELINFLSRKNNTACGRIRKDQLDVMLEKPKTKNSKLTTAMLSLLVGLSFSPKAIGQDSEKTRNSFKTEQARKSKSKKSRLKKKSESTDKLPEEPIKQFSGQVFSIEDGSTLPGINVVLKGTTEGTVTDIDGKYHIKLDQSDVRRGDRTLIFSFIGMQTQEVEITSENNLNLEVRMDSNITELGSVMLGGVRASRWYTPEGLWWRIKSVFY